MPSKRETVLFAWEVTLVVALLLLLRAGVSSTLRWIHNRLNATRGLKSNIPYEVSVFECMQRPLEFLSLFTVGTALAEAISRPLMATGLLKHIRVLRELGIIISAAWFLLRWIDRIRSRFSVAKGIDKAQVDATSRIATVATFVGSLLISLDTIGINVQTVLAFGGIGGVAIGFAGREIISNFFGGFMIYVTRPFSVGEWVRSIEEKELNGTVEDIGWYLTRVRTWDKRPLYIPNSRFSTLIVENGSRMDNRRILHTLHLRHEDMPVVPTIVAAIESLMMGHQELDPRQHRLAYVDSFGEYSVRVWISCYTKSVFLYDFRRVQQDILVKCYEIIRANGAKLATINTRDVRPGVDTDRYGPLGAKASFPDLSNATQRIQTPQPDLSRVPVNNDVPHAQQYGPAPVVRFHNIESGVDFSVVDPNTANGVPAGVSWNTPAPPVSVPNTAMTDPGAMNDYTAESAPHRSTSEAAVAAAAAALTAARRNAARIVDNEKTAAQQSLRPIESGDGTGAPPEPTPATTPPVGQMNITGAKPPRGTQAKSVSLSGPPGTEAVRWNEGKEDAVTKNLQVTPAVNEELTPPSMPLVSNQPSTASTGEMKISKGRKPAQITTPVDPEGEVVESMDRSSPQATEGRVDGIKVSTASAEVRPIAITKSQMNRSVGKPATAGGTAKPSTNIKAAAPTGIKTSPGTVQADGRAGATGQATPAPRGHVQSSPGQASTIQQNAPTNPPAPVGEMNISKARKPVPLPPTSTDPDVINGSRTEAVISQPSNSADEQTEEG